MYNLPEEVLMIRLRSILLGREGNNNGADNVYILLQKPALAV